MPAVALLLVRLLSLHLPSPFYAFVPVTVLCSSDLTTPWRNSPRKQGEQLFTRSVEKLDSAWKQQLAISSRSLKAGRNDGIVAGTRENSLAEVISTSSFRNTTSAVPAPVGTMEGLFRNDIRHSCNEEKRDEFLLQFPQQTTSTSLQGAIKAGMLKLHEVFTKHGLPTILEGGSLLGFVRQCDVIPKDADGDVVMLAEWLHGSNSIESLRESFQKVGGSLEDSLCPEGPESLGCELRVTFEHSSIFAERFHIDIDVLSQEAPCHESPTSCSYIYPLWSGGSVGPTFNRCLMDNVHFEQADFLGKVFWIPAPSIEYLEASYGKEWGNPSGKVYKNCDFAHPVPNSPVWGHGVTPRVIPEQSLANAEARSLAKHKVEQSEKLGWLGPATGKGQVQAEALVGPATGKGQVQAKALVGHQHHTEPPVLRVFPAKNRFLLFMLILALALAITGAVTRTTRKEGPGLQ